MRILLVSDERLSKELGASKVVIELAEELERLGWECRVTSLPELVGSSAAAGDQRPAALRAYLREHAHEHDVVDYGHSHLPFPRAEFSPAPLFVARSVLLAHHFAEIRIPVYRTWKALVHALVYGLRDRRQYRGYVDRSTATLKEADLVNVSNEHDKSMLIKHGIEERKIVVLPFGISSARSLLFEQLPTVRPHSNTIAFVGTFDSRKGASDFPHIVRHIVQRVPDARFRLLGTYKSAAEVLARFPAALRPRLEIIPQFPSDELPHLLASCSVGVFPSYVEGFGFGVLEMLAAGLPVIAYDAPGPPMMLRPQDLVPPGDTRALADKVARLLKSETDLAAARDWARKRSRDFLWSDIARRTSDVYVNQWQARQAALAQ